MTNKSVVEARLNWGNWIADCPIHGEGVAELVKPGQDFICSRCYPGIHAQTRVPHPQNNALRISVPDIAAREEAIKLAEAEGHVYQVVFPKEMEQIMAIVRLRPLRNMNWRPGQSLADLRRENEEYGVSNGLR